MMPHVVLNTSSNRNACILCPGSGIHVNFDLVPFGTDLQIVIGIITGLRKQNIVNLVIGINNGTGFVHLSFEPDGNTKLTGCIQFVQILKTQAIIRTVEINRISIFCIAGACPCGIAHKSTIRLTVFMPDHQIPRQSPFMSQVSLQKYPILITENFTEYENFSDRHISSI